MSRDRGGASAIGVAPLNRLPHADAASLDWPVPHMPRFFDDDIDDIQGPIDLDRLAVDSDYRRAVMLRLKTESEQSGPSRPAVLAEPTQPRKD